ncbi:MAG: tRNA uridine-5-carboxymethylaminomethyl(34) synthesis enzyme MnmG [Bacteroidaceae bacterium]|nr:tRNA uridine-5-carboxymethylaminomethyl(34) synthesis enzyme MnmG [Bacteroidaceae bacterium]
MKLYYDVVVIGAGHAGCEAAMASANMGAKTCLLTMDMNKIAQMSCNPAVGGIAKGQIVREVDALGGGMGLVTDATAIQFRMLNRSKGPAMWSPRAQCDRGKFIWKWRQLLDSTPNLDIWQDQAESISPTPALPPVGGSLKNDSAAGYNRYNSNSQSNSIDNLSTLGGGVGGGLLITTIWGVEIYAKSVVVTAGTFLNGLMHIGRKQVAGGRCAEPASYGLTESLNALGITSQRMKTGTPVRIDRKSVDFSQTEIQEGEADWHRFSYFETEQRKLKQLPCWTFNTNPECHKALLEGLDDSPLYNGQIKSIGPRYCPSVETKLVTFPDREKHPLFLEPEGEDTDEMYLNGFSSSMPMEVQLNALRKIPALRDVRVYRPGYAIEYDFFDPTQLHHSLESKLVPGLFFAGQVNGTTGYEEAAGQGLVAGANAAIFAGADPTYINGRSDNGGPLPLVMKRDESYIGVLIDDLVTKGVDEPYRMFTSRAEYRILLRQDDADARLTEMSYNLGIAKRDRYDLWLSKKQHIDAIETFCRKYSLRPKDLNSYLESIGSTPLHTGMKLFDLIARPEISLQGVAEVIPALKQLLDAPENRREEICEAAEIKMKYSGYIVRERQVAEKMRRLEDIKIRGHFDYASMDSLSTEARQKLVKINPETLAQASRIPGVSPSDINVLLVLMKR